MLICGPPVADVLEVDWGHCRLVHVDVDVCGSFKLLDASTECEYPHMLSPLPPLRGSDDVGECQCAPIHIVNRRSACTSCSLFSSRHLTPSCPPISEVFGDGTKKVTIGGQEIKTLGIFKKHITPVWEDRANVDGYQLEASRTFNVECMDCQWENLVLGMIGKPIEGSRSVCMVCKRWLVVFAGDEQKHGTFCTSSASPRLFPDVGSAIICTPSVFVHALKGMVLWY